MGQCQKVFHVIGLPEGEEKVLCQKKKKEEEEKKWGGGGEKEEGEDGEEGEEGEEIMAETFPNLSKTQI